MTNPLRTLQEYGQSVWLDFVSRDLLKSGELGRLIAEVIQGVAKKGEDGDPGVEESVKARVIALCRCFPIYP